MKQKVLISDDTMALEKSRERSYMGL